jgi:hypothetical protein
MRSMRAPSLLVVSTFVLLTGCPAKKPEGNPTPSPTATATTAASASASAAAPKAAGVRAIAGVGDVPVWAEEKERGTKCKAKDPAKLAALGKGTDATLSDGSADVDALAKDVAGDCVAARHELADKLNDGGYERYKKKSYDEANRWWRAALVVRPAAILPRYNLACSLALVGKKPDAIWALQELAHAADADDPKASNILEKAKSDDDLKSLRGDADFEAALRAATGTLVGPRTEPETAAAGVKLLPAAFLKVPDRNGVNDDGFVHYKPALLKFWTWRPDDATELLVATVVHDPSTLGQPKGDSNQDYGGLVVLQRVGGKLTLLEAMKTGEVPPTISAGKNKRVVFTFDDYCGSVKGTLAWNASKVVVTKEACPE